MDVVLDAIRAFWSYLTSIEIVPLLIAVCCHVVKTACTSRAWRNVLAYAYPGVRVRWRAIYAAYVSGVGVNAILPARSGDLVRLYLAHRAIPGATYATLIASSIVLSVVDTIIVLSLFLWALTQNVLPSLDRLPDLPSFDFHWFLEHKVVSQALLAVLALAIVILTVVIRERAEHLREHLKQPFAAFRPLHRYLFAIVPWQLADWTLRLATIWFFLGAFGIDQTPRNVLLVQVASSLATLVPISPGGVGTEQTLITFVFRGVAPTSIVLPFSVGMKITLTVTNVAVGVIALGLTLRTFSFRDAITQARASRPGEIREKV
jgi:uncharacterized protein (TIRG00374 family)